MMMKMVMLGWDDYDGTYNAMMEMMIMINNDIDSLRLLMIVMNDQ